MWNSNFHSLVDRSAWRTVCLTLLVIQYGLCSYHVDEYEHYKVFICMEKHSWGGERASCEWSVEGSSTKVRACVQCDMVIEDLKATVCLPYVQISEPLKMILKGLHIRTVMRPHQMLKQRLVTSQGCHPRHGEIKCNLLYLMCRMPVHSTYVGEAKRKLCKRMDGYKRMSQNVNSQNVNSQNINSQNLILRISSAA